MTAVVLDRPVVAPTTAPTTTPGDELVLVVTQADIDQGRQMDVRHCAIALAAQRQFGEGGGWWSMDSELNFLPRLSEAVIEHWYSAPAISFVSAFDHDRSSVHPERFIFRRRTPDAQAVSGQ